MSDRYALVDGDGLVVNVVEWDGVSDWSPPEGLTCMEADEAVSVGWTRQSGAWVGPAQEDPQWI
ncbi:MAG: hypothetical protein ACM3W4_08065 [Ignavibacteriales bacterium]